MQLGTVSFEKSEKYCRGSEIVETVAPHLADSEEAVYVWSLHLGTTVWSPRNPRYIRNDERIVRAQLELEDFFNGHNSRVALTIA